MKTAVMPSLQTRLQDRRARVAETLTEIGSSPDLLRLLDEVDAALQRFETSSFGTCVLCDGPLSEEQLAANPLAAYCLCELTPERRERLEHDLASAWQIQAGLLPEQNLSCSGWETHYRYVPAGPVSGDYCDLVAGDGSLFFVLGDVSGKGVSASVLMAHLHGLLRSLIDSGLGIEGILEKANRIFGDNTGPNRYATLVVGRAEANGEVEICNAGHLPPLLVRGGAVSRVDAGGFPVGLFEESPYNLQRFRMEPGETLFLYTDGMTEARNENLGEYGIDALSGTLEQHRGAVPAALAAACLRDVNEHLAGAEQDDDLTMLVVRRT